MSLNIKNEIVMEIQNAEKVFRAHFPQGVSYQECYDFLVKCAEKIIEMSKANEAASSSAKATADGAEDPEQLDATQQPTTTTSQAAQG
jgi:hypothetical protein